MNLIAHVEISVSDLERAMRFYASVFGVAFGEVATLLSLIHISEPTRHFKRSRMPSSA